LFQKDTPLYSFRTFGDWVCSGSEEVENVKSLRHTEKCTDESQALLNQKRSAELKINKKITQIKA
jgi:hypothetical protein